jgi:type VI secretion system secreted protein Hcp
MALNAYMRLTGDIQGEINGSVTQAGREDSIMVIAFSHEVESPRNASSGLATGKRQHKPLIITKEIDKSTPLLINALTTNENLSEVILQFWQPSRSGREFQYYTIELTNARIVDIHQEMLNNKYPENMQHSEREHISFVYQKITWTYEDGGITSTDNWGTHSTMSTKSSPTVKRKTRLKKK